MLPAIACPSKLPDRIARYRKRVLAPAGLDFSGGARRHGSYSASRGVLEGDSRVWKFYGPEKAQNARNSVLASNMLAARGIPTARIYHADVDDGALGAHGLACIVMERIRGKPFDPANLTQRGTALAPTLARMHSITSSCWGTLTRPYVGPTLHDFVGRVAARYLHQIEPLASRIAHSPLQGASDWLARRLDRQTSAERPFHFVHGDMHERNLLRTSDGRVHLIDLDRVGYRHFGFDLADLILRNDGGRIRSADATEALEAWEARARPFLDDYFSAAPESYRALWHEMRGVCFLLMNLRQYLDGLRLASPESRLQRDVGLERIIGNLNTRRQLIDNLLRS